MRKRESEITNVHRNKTHLANRYSNNLFFYNRRVYHRPNDSKMTGVHTAHMRKKVKNKKKFFRYVYAYICITSKNYKIRKSPYACSKAFSIYSWPNS